MNLRELIGFGLYSVGKMTRHQDDFLSLYFHDPSPVLFEKIILWCKQEGYKFIDIRECLAILSEEKAQEGKVVYFSFDDGWRSNLELIPILEKYNVPISIFVSIAPLFSGNYWWEYVIQEYGTAKKHEFKKKPYADFVREVKLLENKCTYTRSSITEKELIVLGTHPLISVQSHTMTHPILVNCPNDVLLYELEQSKRYLEEVLTQEIFAFSYPNGDFGEREITAVKQAGYKIAFTTASTMIGLNQNLLTVPRMAMNTNGGYYENLSKILGIWQKFIKR